MAKSGKSDGPALDRSRIAVEALALIDEVGLDKLSMRALGDRLGVEAMAIYYHFPSKADVLDAAADVLAAKLRTPEGVDWREQVRDGARRYRQLAIDHPNAFMLLTTRRAAGPYAFRAYEDILSVLHEAGFEGPALARAFRVLGYYVGGAGHAEVATRRSGEFSQLGRAGPPDAADYPLLAGLAPELAPERMDALFEAGLELILEALPALAKETG